MKRSSGILLHPTSLPGPEGIGTFGEPARRFIDDLVEGCQSIWQILPLGPTGFGHSPYNALSAFAGNPLLIELEPLVEVGDLPSLPALPDQRAPGRVDFDWACHRKPEILGQAADNFFQQAPTERHHAYQAFCHQQASWLDDFALFMALRTSFNDASWAGWPIDLRHREPASLAEYRQRLKNDCRRQKYQQFVFFEQWFQLKTYANRKGIKIFGDLPIFVAYDSADVWANQGYFQLDADGLPTAVAGVPPDYFSETGQRWGNPLYRWDRLQDENFGWWLDRCRWALKTTDLLRIDHFRGFQASWSIPAEEPTAVNGHWEEVPGRHFFHCLHREFPELPIIAEDLGLITPEVEALRDEYDLPGMKVLHFAFDSGPTNPYLPHNFSTNCVVYTGTHDNNTTLGWWRSLTPDQQGQVADYLDKKHPKMPWDLIALAQASPAILSMIPCQDLLSLPGSCRFNRPGYATGNWDWRLQPGQLTDGILDQLAEMTRRYNRHHS